MAKQKASTPPAKAPAAAPASSSYFPLSSLRDDIDRAFDRMFRDFPRFGGLMTPDFFNAPLGKMAAIEPRVDVTEDDTAYEITAAASPCAARRSPSAKRRRRTIT